MDNRNLVSGVLLIGAALVFGLLPTPAMSDIIWSGDYESGDFQQWHSASTGAPNFSGMPDYCRPSYDGGDGSCLSVTTEVARTGNYAAKFTVKNSANALGEPEDCGGMPECSRRIVALKSWYSTETESGTALPYMAERWISISHYVPADWNDSGGGFGPLVFELKPYINNSKVSPSFSIALNKGAWKIFHRTSEEKHYAGQLPWQQQMFYTGNEDGVPYPSQNAWPDGLADFPDVNASHQALQSVNKGGWTDWVIHIKFDARGSAAGGTGFIEVWKREDSGPWVEVLDIRPRVVNRGGMTFDRGIAYNTPARSGPYDSFGDHGGHAIVAGMYMDKRQVWDQSANRVIYNDNIRIGDETSSLSEMAPDGAANTAGNPPPPKPNPPQFSSP